MPSTSYYGPTDTDPSGLPLNGRLESVTEQRSHAGDRDRRAGNAPGDAECLSYRAKQPQPIIEGSAMTGILSLWDAVVETAAVFAIVGITIGFIIGMVGVRRAWARLGAVLGILVLLLILPPILMGLWQSLSSWRKTEIVAPL